MMCYKDKQFCTEKDCYFFDKECEDALTDKVLADAKKWWGGDDAPICVGERPDCYVNKEVRERTNRLMMLKDCGDVHDIKPGAEEK